MSLEEETELRVQKSRHLALLAAQAGLDKKCLDVEIIDVVGKVDYADFLVLMTGSSDRHVAAIARGVDEQLSKAGSPPLAMEGLTAAEWVLIDFFDIVVHVLAEGARDLYDLSGLWMDASRVPVPERSEAHPRHETRGDSAS
jgi:ribosome-associated protein